MTLTSILLWGYWFTWTICCILEVEPSTDRTATQED